MSATEEERAAAGAALLDEREPGWHQRIDLGILDIDNCERCVLGQVYAEAAGDEDDHYGYDIALRALGLRTGRQERGHGFDGAWDEWDDLAAKWRELIGSRRAAS